MSTNSGSILTRWAAIGAAVAVAIGAAGIGGFNLVNAEVSSGERPVFVPISPCRITDTRSAPNNVGPRLAPIAAAETLAITAHGENGECIGASTIPVDAVALSLNVTALGATQQTFLTFWGEGDNPGTANLNPAPGQPPTPNAVNTPLSASGTFNVYNDAGAVNVVIDVNGYYAHHNHDDRYYAQDETYSRDEADGRYYSQAEVDALLDALRPDEIVLAPQAFTPVDPVDDLWKISTALFHGTSVESECVTAALPLPAGRTLDDVEVVMAMSNGGRVDVRVQALRSGPGPFDAESVLTVFDEQIFTGPVAGRTGEFIVFFNSTHDVLDDRVYGIELCTEDLAEIFAVKATLD